MINTQLKFEGRIATVQKLLHPQGIAQNFFSFKASFTLKVKIKVPVFETRLGIYVISTCFKLKVKFKMIRKLSRSQGIAQRVTEPKAICLPSVRGGHNCAKPTMTCLTNNIPIMFKADGKDTFDVYLIEILTLEFSRQIEVLNQ